MNAAMNATASYTRHSHIKHFLIAEGDIREFSHEQAARIAMGSTCLPEYAQKKLPYLQVSLDEVEQGLRVQTSGAMIAFDDQGRMASALPPDSQELLSSFEHDTCVQLALNHHGTVH
jgi:hypothetical protein